jgi:hypothetical protein
VTLQSKGSGRFFPVSGYHSELCDRYDLGDAAAVETFQMVNRRPHAFMVKTVQRPKLHKVEFSLASVDKECGELLTPR